MGVDQLVAIDEKRRAANREALIVGLSRVLDVKTDKARLRVKAYVDGLADPNNPHEPDWIGLTHHTDGLNRLRTGVYVHQRLRPATPSLGDLKPGDPFPELGPNMTRLGHELKQALGGDTLLDYHIVEREEIDTSIEDGTLQRCLAEAEGVELIWSSPILR